MAKKKSKGKGGYTSTSRGEVVELDAKIVLNAKKTHGQIGNRKVRSFVALKVQVGSTFRFALDPADNTVTSSNPNWAPEPFEVLDNEKILLVVLRYKGQAIKARPGFIDDTLDLDVTVANEPDTGTATIDHVVIAVAPTDPIV